ncbi:ABC transporter permease [Muricoccus aerilatus]|uniref:ABC transporter permease n=1 Tax=Muricoccus aerilatus TaxID=452982 RepID=UPI000693B2F2
MSAEGIALPREPRLLGLRRGTWPRILAPLLMGLVALGAWEFAVRHFEVPPYILPGPVAIGQTLAENWTSLLGSLAVTLRITLLALLLAVVTGVALAMLFSASRWVEMTFLPYAVMLQVTPVVSIAPLIIIWVDNVQAALLVCAWIVAFFPIVSNTTIGLNSTDRNLLDLYRLLGASRWQTLVGLRLPAALPFFLAGLRISGGLSLIGAIVAEFVAGTGGNSSGLAYRILEAGYQLQIPRMFAALALISLSGVAIFLVLSLLSHLLLRRWHESALGGER